MCDFFSFVMDRNDNIYYLDKEQRKKCVGTNNNPDSHAYICKVHNLNEDKVNKYEFLKELDIDKEVFDTTQYQKDKLDYFIKNINLKDLVWDSESAYFYCKYIQDDKEVRNRITDSHYAYRYCKHIQDREDVRKYIIDSYDAYRYCKDVQDREEVRNMITDSRYAYLYCEDVQDREDVRKYIID